MTDDMSSDFVDADTEYGFEPAVSDNLEPIGAEPTGRAPRRRGSAPRPRGWGCSAGCRAAPW